MFACAPCNVDDRVRTAYLESSAARQGFKVEYLGLGKPFTLEDKLPLFRDYLRGGNPDDIVVFTDAFDVFYTAGLDTIREKFLAFNTDIVISAERQFSHQVAADRQFYETLNRTNSPYTFLNSGGIIGRRNKLLALLEGAAAIEKPTAHLENGGFNDQTVLSYYLVRSWAKHRVCLDYNCDIFYVASSDWDNVRAHVGYDMTVKATSRRPCIVHVPWKTRYAHVLDILYRDIYGSAPFVPMPQIEGKFFTWNERRILFLKDGRLQAFGEGQYTAIDEYRVEAFFGTRSHIVKFDPEFMSFISVRKEDYELVVGRRIADEADASEVAAEAPQPETSPATPDECVGGGLCIRGDGGTSPGSPDAPDGGKGVEDTPADGTGHS